MMGPAAAGGLSVSLVRVLRISREGTAAGCLERSHASGVKASHFGPRSVNVDRHTEALGGLLSNRRCAGRGHRLPSTASSCSSWIRTALKLGIMENRQPKPVATLVRLEIMIF